MLFCGHCGYLITNICRIMHALFDYHSIVYLMPIIPIIQIEKTKCEYPDHNLHIIGHIIWVFIWLIWCLLDAYWMIIVFIWVIWSISVISKCEWLTRFCIHPAMLPQNTCGQACTSSEGNLWVAWFITGKRSQRNSMCEVRIVQKLGCKLAITVFALEIQELFGLLALCLTRLMANWQPQRATCQFEQAGSNSPL